MKTDCAFKNDPAIKQKFLSRIQEHRKADELLQGYGYWSDGKGCAVGCLAHRDYEPHKYLSEAWNIDERLLHLADTIFEGLPEDAAPKWPEQFVDAIPLGADTSLIWYQFALWMLRDAGFMTVTNDNRGAINAMIDLHARAVDGDMPKDDEWGAAETAAWSAESAARLAESVRLAESAARSAAWSARSAAESARSAAWSAAWSARSAAWSAAWSARSAARSVAWSARSAVRSAVRSTESAVRSTESAVRSTESAVRSAVYQKMADKLIRLLKAAG